MGINKLSVFLPIYNEEGAIVGVVEKVVKVLKGLNLSWELLLINDGSKDSTLDKIIALSKKYPNVKIINHKQNMGYGAALKSGFYQSKYPWIAFIDSDDQFDFTEIKSFIQKQQETGADMVIGYYKDRKVSFSKKITSKMWEYLVYLMFGLKVKDIDCGFKLISKKVIDKISKLQSERGAFISSELLIKAKKSGFSIVEIPVTHHPRTKGVGTGRKLNVIIKSFIDLMRLWKRLR